MKVLWFCNMQLPAISKDLGISAIPFGGWLSGLSCVLATSNEVDLYICVPGEKNKKKQGSTDGYTYYLYNKTKPSIDEFCDIIKTCSPDVVHIFGTEYAHALLIIQAAINCGLKDKTVVSIQGLISIYCRESHYFAGLPNKVVKSWSLGDILRRKNIALSQKALLKLGLSEKKTISLATHVIGRTDWDYSCVKQINCKAIYHHCNESLREEFYSSKWSIENCEKNSIFVSQSDYSIKGFHLMIEAFTEVLKNYPDAHLYTTGHNPLKLDFISKIKQSSYNRYIGKLIKKNNLQNNVTFLGTLDARQMCSRYLRTHVFASPSSIENSPNSLGEAMLLGVPTVSSDVGGVKNMMTHSTEGFIYPFNEPYMLAHYIMKLFEDDSLAKKMSENAQKHASITHNRVNNTKTLIDIYSNL